MIIRLSVTWYDVNGSDSSTSFRCQPAGHLVQRLTSCAALRMKLFHFPLLAQASLARNWKQKSLPAHTGRLCRGEGIRTLGKLETYTRFPSVLLKPLGHPSKWHSGERLWGCKNSNLFRRIEKGINILLELNQRWFVDIVHVSRFVILDVYTRALLWA